jgi:WD40 repeat protein
VAVIPSGDGFLSGSSDSSLKMWSETGRRQVAEFAGHKGGITCLAVCPNESTFISGSTDSTLRLWNIDKVCEIATFVGHTERVNCVGITPNGDFCISGSADSSLIVWSLTDLCQVSALTGHTDWIDSLVVSADGQYCASGSRDLSVRLWGVKEAEAITSYDGHTADIYCLAFAPKGDLLVSGSADNLVKIWSLSTRKELATLKGHTDWIYCLAITADGEFLVTGAADHSVRLWSLRKLKPVAVFLGHSAEVATLYITPDGQYCVSGGYDCSLKLWSLRERREVSGLKSHSKEVICAVPILGGKWCLSGSADNSLKLQPLPLPQASPPSSLFVANLASLRAGHSVPALICRALLPQLLNSLHISSYYGQWARLQEGLESGIPVLKGTFGSPLTIALDRVWPKCAETLLTHFTQLARLEGSDMVWPAFEAIEDDLASLLRLRSPLLLPFLQVLMQPSAQQPLPEFLSTCNLPRTRLVKHRYIKEDLIGTAPAALESCEPVRFRISLIRRNCDAGSRESVQLLSCLSKCGVEGAVKTRYTREVIEEKWRAFLPLTLLIAMLYACVVGVSAGILLVEEESYWLHCLYAGLNGAFLLFELLAVVLLGLSQAATSWTFLNLSQSMLSLLWLLEPRLGFVSFALTFLRGFGLFRIFSSTRLHVHMAFSVLNEASSFLVILAYATLCLLTLPITLSEETAAWYWETAGEYGYNLAISLAIGITIGVLLHLLTAVVGAAYEKTQIVMEEADLKMRLHLVLTYESFLIWRRAKGCKRALVICEQAKAKKWEEIDRSKVTREALDEKLNQVLSALVVKQQ